MSQLPTGSSMAMRVSEEDRRRTAAELSSHCVAGRISVDELEQRLEAAMRAETVSELQRVVVDLPSGSRSVERKGSTRMPLGLPGIRPFVRQLVVPESPARVRQVALATLAPAFSRSGFELRSQSGNGLAFERVRRTGWFSVSRERVLISFESHDATSALMIVYGRAAWAVRRQIAALSF